MPLIIQFITYLSSLYTKVIRREVNTFANENVSLFFHQTIHFFFAYFLGVYDIANVTFAFNEPVDVVAV